MRTRNNKALYESIMRKVSRVVKQSLNEMASGRSYVKSYPRGDFNMYELDDNEKDFLRNYFPKSPYCTSREEIEKVGQFFELDTMTSEEIQALRNSVVEFYSDLYEELQESDHKLAFRYFRESMASMTAILDIYKTRR